MKIRKVLFLTFAIVLLCGTICADNPWEWDKYNSIQTPNILGSNVIFVSPNSINQTISIIGVNQKTLIINNSQTLTANLIVPQNISLVILKGGMITKASTYTLTINGPFEAGLYQVFSGFAAGDVTGTFKEVYPEWWGNNTVPGTTDMGDEITAAIAAVPAGGTLLFSPGTYAYATSPNFGVSFLKIRGQGAILLHTGTGNAFSLDGGAVGSGIYGMSVSDLIIQGNAASDNGIFAQSIHHSNFTNLKVTGCATTGNALLIRWCVANTWTNFRVSSNEGFAGPQPANGIYLAERASGGFTTTQTFINPIIEGVSNAGIYLYYCNNNHFIGGTSEANAYGVYANDNQTTHPAGNNIFSGIGLEANSINDIYITAGGVGGNNFLGIFALGSSEILSGFNKFIGGIIYTLTLGAASYHNRLVGIDIPVAFTDNNYQAMSYPGTNSYTNVMGPGAIFLPNTMESLTGSPYRVTFDNAAPTTGTWNIGSIVFNGSPTTGQPIGWMCTVAGTPGTWKAMGNLEP